MSIDTAGELDHRIEIRREVETGRDEWNAPIIEEVTVATLWCNRRDVSAREAYRAQEIGAELTTRFTVRWSNLAATITPLDWILFRGQRYNIVGVRDVGRQQFREIDAVARADKEAEP